MSGEQDGEITLEGENNFHFFKDDAVIDNFMSKTVEKNMLFYILDKAVVVSSSDGDDNNKHIDK